MWHDIILTIDVVFTFLIGVLMNDYAALKSNLDAISAKVDGLISRIADLEGQLANVPVSQAQLDEAIAETVDILGK